MIHAFGADAAHRLLPLARMMGATGIATLAHADVAQGVIVLEDLHRVGSRDLVAFAEMHPSMAKLPSQEAAALAFAAIALGAALLVTAPLALIEHGAWQLHPELVGAMAWSVLVLTLGGSSLLYLLIARGAATRVTSLMYLVPPCTAVLAWLLFDEPLDAGMIAGIALSVSGVLLVVRQSARKA